MSDNKLSLLELNQLINETLQEKFSNKIWLVAEIGEINFNQTGHAYLELIEKDKNSDKIIAKARATIWSYTLRMLKPYFETTTNQELTSGLKILINVSVEFHEIYGFSLNIKDIDPTYTLGDIERRRLEILRKLEEEGIINMNKDIDLPIVIQKIAIISSATAAGYEDFTNQLDYNKHGYKFYYKLFPALMQGQQTEQSIINALEKIFENADFFDVVVIIRGGGSKSDLMSFDKYDLAYFITQFPIPVISGIGHEKDISVVDIVSHTSLKTPTAVAEFLISNITDFDNYINELFKNIESTVIENIQTEKENLLYIAQKFSQNVKNKTNTEKTKLLVLQEKFINKTKNRINNSIIKMDFYNNSIKNIVKYNFNAKRTKLDREFEKLKYRATNKIYEIQEKINNYEKRINILDPKNVMKKGYSITKFNGKIIKNAKLIKKGDKIETILYQDKIISLIEETNKDNIIKI
ncbi:MAG: exodeoxyribonuclease VII large subunit [Bacteroidales bacterium]|nr:exodeoxyribonuclease VII large subunit [Bacteroidales bacterium]MBN2756884.1 exodeoxyribonuclease VII large subunit [Bacteroidales bacterium]